MQYTKLNWRHHQPYSERFDDIYYSSSSEEGISGEQEFRHVFFKHNGLPQRWLDRDQFIIAELGFGGGLNCLLTIREWLNQYEDNDTCRCLHYIAIERYPLSPESIREIHSRHHELKPFYEELIAVYPPPIEGSHSRPLFNNRVIIHFRFLDVYEALRDEHFRVDAWYLDGFSPAKNIDMWSSDLCRKIAQNSQPGTTCSTYSAAGSVKRNLTDAGLEVSKVAGIGNKRDMLVARMVDQGALSNNQKYRINEKPWFIKPSTVVYRNKHAVIVGAGIAGLTTAYSLVKHGWTVNLIDKYGTPACETSSNPAAIVYPRLSLDDEVDTAFNVQAFCYAVNFLQSLQKQAKHTFWFECGLKQLMDEKRLLNLIDKYSFNADFISSEQVLTEMLSNKKNNQASKIADQVYAFINKAGVVLPAVLCETLLKVCGDRIDISQADIDTIERDENGWRCRSNDQQVCESDVLILANGTGVNYLNLIEGEISRMRFDSDFAIDSVRGQSLILRENTQSTEINNVVNAGFYLTPSIGGWHYLGATYSRNDTNRAATVQDNNNLLDSMEAILPRLFTVNDIEDVWVGFRATSKDRVPVVGQVADSNYFLQHYADIKHGKKDKTYPAARHLQGLYISAAHGSRGFTTSFLCAEVIASLINGSPAPVSKAVLNFINPSRFIVHDLKRR